MVRNASQTESLPSAARAAAASMMTSPGMGIGTPVALASMMAKIAARPYNSRNASRPSIRLHLSLARATALHPAASGRRRRQRHDQEDRLEYGHPPSSD